ncbi:MAG: hypothetical protein P1V18_02890 [Candidatus Gracilibacteria bacterium]|nr:hypothetical protein [Candidatus Gracilibacteria bacterium]
MNLLSLRKVVASASTAVLLWSSVVVPGLGAFTANAAATGSDHYAYAHCQLLEDEGVVKSGTCGKLNDSISKGEFVKVILYVAAIGEDADATSAATDVSDDFVRAAVNTAYEEGLLSGEGGDVSKSGAGNTLNRAVAATIGGRAYSVVDEFPSDGSMSDLTGGQWYSDYAKKAVSAGVIVGKVKDGVRNFAPADILTYGESMALAFQFARAEIAYDEWTSAGNSGVPSTSAITALDALDVYNFNVSYDFSDVVVDDGDDNTNTNKPEVPEVTGPESFSAMALNTDSGVNVPKGANNVRFAAFEVSGNANVTEVEIVRSGPGDESDIGNVYLYYGDQLLADVSNQFAYNGNGMQLAASNADMYRTERRTTGKSINSEDQKVRFFVNIAVRGTGVLEIRGDLSATAGASSQHRFSLIEVKTSNEVYEFAANVAQYMGNLMTTGGTAVGEVTIRPNASINDVYVGQKDAVVTRFELQLDSNESGMFQRIALQFRGGVSGSDISNLKLFMVGTSDAIATTPTVGFNDLATFIICATKVNDVCQPMQINKGDTRVFYVTANLDGAQNNEDIKVDLDENTDLVMIGGTLGFGMTVTEEPGGTFTTTANVLGADVSLSFLGPAAGDISAGVNSALLAKWSFVNNSGGRLQLRDWQVSLTDANVANLVQTAGNARYTNMRLVVLDDEDRDIATLFSSVDMDNTTSVGVVGTTATISFQGSYDVQAGKNLVIGFMTNLESTLVASTNVLVALQNVAVNDRVRDDNNDGLGAGSINPSAAIAGAGQRLKASAIQVTLSSAVGNNAYALGESSVILAVHNFLADAGQDINFSQLQYTTIGGPNGATFGNTAFIDNAQRTFLSIRLKVMDDQGILQDVSDIESLDNTGKLLFDNLEGRFTVKNGKSIDLYLVADINSSGQPSNAFGTPALAVANIAYQFQLDNTASATTTTGRNIATGNLIDAVKPAQTITVSTGGNILLSNQSQEREQYIAQTSSNSVTIDALIFKVESENATSILKDFRVDVDTGRPSVDSAVVNALLTAAAPAFLIQQGAVTPSVTGVNGGIIGVTTVCSVTVIVGVGPAADELDCADGAATIALSNAGGARTIAEQAAVVRSLIGIAGYKVSGGSGAGIIFERTGASVDANIVIGGAQAGSFNTSNRLAGQRSSAASGSVGFNDVDLPDVTDTLVIGTTNPGAAQVVLCTVTFNDVNATGLEDELDCSDNVAVIDTDADTGVDGAPRTAAQLATVLASLTNVGNFNGSASGKLVTFVQVSPYTAVTLTFATSTVIGAEANLLSLAPGDTTMIDNASAMLASAQMFVDGVFVGSASTISATQVRFDDVDHEFNNDIPKVVAIRLKVKQVVTGGADAGQNFKLVLRQGVFQTANNGSFVSKAGTELNPSTPSIFNANRFIVQQATVTFSSGGTISSDLLSASLQDMFKFKMEKSGTGTVEIGDGLAGSSIEFEITKTGDDGVPSEPVKIDRCEIRDASNTVLATKNAPFNSDSFGTPFPTLAGAGGQDRASVAFVTFNSSEFVSGKRLQGGGGVYTVYCNVTAVQAGKNASFQVSLTQNVSLAIIDNDVSVMNQTNKFNGIPVTGVSRSAVN